MIDPKRAQATGLPAMITGSLASLWRRYANGPPSDVRTGLRGDVVTCVLVDAVGSFESGLHSPSAQAGLGGAGAALARYRAEAVDAIVRITGQRVSSFVSSHDRETDVATEIFTLEPPPGWQSRRPSGVQRARHPASAGRGARLERTRR
jgi:hypothetical protein